MNIHSLELCNLVALFDILEVNVVKYDKNTIFKIQDIYDEYFNQFVDILIGFWEMIRLNKNSLSLDVLCNGLKLIYDNFVLLSN